MKQVSKFLFIFTCLLLTSSCDEGKRLIDPKEKLDIIDPDKGLNRQDFSDMHKIDAYVAPGDMIGGNVLEPPIPDLAEILAAPKPPKIAQTQLVSVAVTDDVPLKDVLIELARLADIDIEVDAGITGGISFRAKDRPFNEVIERIAGLAGLRYKVQNNVLRVERDTPYIQTYSLDMLNVDRASQGNISVNSNGTSSGGSSSGGSSSGGSSGGSSSGSSGSAGGGSSATITANSISDFWVRFSESIDQILKFQTQSMVSSASVASQPAPAPAPTPGAPGAPAAPAAAPAPVPPSPTGNTSTNGTFFTLNRQAATLTVSATERQHDTIKRFIRTIENNMSSQVLIEAKIVEVSLNDRYQTGINWANLGGNSVKFSGDLDAVAPGDTTRGAATITLLKNDILRTGINLSAAVKLLDEFGTTRALSSPRLNAMNNQQAVLSFVENLRYFKVELEVTDAVPGVGGAPGTPAKLEVTSEPQTAPVGIVLTLQPSINKETNEITLSVRPTLSKVTKFVKDPGFEIAKAQASSIVTGAALTALLATESPYPQLEVRELDSILKVKSGQIMVIGGLLEDKTINADAGLPGVGEVPYLGNLFKSVDKQNIKKELVILIRATIVDPQGYMDNADKGIYQKFMQDPRPIEFPTEQ